MEFSILNGPGWQRRRRRFLIEPEAMVTNGISDQSIEQVTEVEAHFASFGYINPELEHIRYTLSMRR